MFKQGTVFIHPDKLGFYVLNQDVEIGDDILATHFIAFGNVEMPEDGHAIPLWFAAILLND